jgi:membrane protease YdiL (CAAX protease family)
MITATHAVPQTGASQSSAGKYPSFPRKPISLRMVCAIVLISAAAAVLVVLFYLQNRGESNVAQLEQWRKELLSIKAMIARPLFWVVEEIIFRGFLLQVLRRRFSLFVALFVSGLLFALEHFGKGIPVMGLAFVFSCYFGWLMVRTDSLYAPIVAHCSFDAAALYLICPIVLAYGPPVGGRYSFSLWWYGFATLILIAGVSVLRLELKRLPRTY